MSIVARSYQMKKKFASVFSESTIENRIWKIEFLKVEIGGWKLYLLFSIIKAL